jgi:hypothetical protein
MKQWKGVTVVSSCRLCHCSSQLPFEIAVIVARAAEAHYRHFKWRNSPTYFQNIKITSHGLRWTKNLYENYRTRRDLQLCQDLYICHLRSYSCWNNGRNVQIYLTDGILWVQLIGTLAHHLQTDLKPQKFKQICQVQMCCADRRRSVKGYVFGQHSSPFALVPLMVTSGEAMKLLSL